MSRLNEREVFGRPERFGPRTMPIFCGDDGLNRLVGNHRQDGLRHGHGGLAQPKQNDAVNIVQIAREAIRKMQRRPHPPRVGCNRVGGVNRAQRRAEDDVDVIAQN